MTTTHALKANDFSLNDWRMLSSVPTDGRTFEVRNAVGEVRDARWDRGLIVPGYSGFSAVAWREKATS